jgi:hypothetical protein
MIHWLAPGCHRTTQVTALAAYAPLSIIPCNLFDLSPSTPSVIYYYLHSSMRQQQSQVSGDLQPGFSHSATSREPLALLPFASVAKPREPDRTKSRMRKPCDLEAGHKKRRRVPTLLLSFGNFCKNPKTPQKSSLNLLTDLRRCEKIPSVTGELHGRTEWRLLDRSSDVWYTCGAAVEGDHLMKQVLLSCTAKVSRHVNVAPLRMTTSPPNCLKAWICLPFWRETVPAWKVMLHTIVPCI